MPGYPPLQARQISVRRNYVLEGSLACSATFLSGVLATRNAASEADDVTRFALYRAGMSVGRYSRWLLGFSTTTMGIFARGPLLQ